MKEEKSCSNGDVPTDGIIGGSSAYDWIRHSWVLKIWYKYQQESPAQCGSYIYYEFCYIVLTPSEFVLVPLGIGDLEWKYSF